MLLSKEDQASLKAWLRIRLANVSYPEDEDADPEILTEYVVLLVVHDLDDEAVRNLCLQELSELLPPESVPDFVNDLFRALKYRSFVPGAPPPPAKSLKHALVKMEPDSQQTVLPSGPSQLNGSRKRSHAERDDGPSGPYGPSDYNGRPTKQVRVRGGNQSRGINGAGRGGSSFAAQDFPMFPFDPNNAMASFMPFTAALMQQWPLGLSPPNNARQPCIYFARKSGCIHGSKCKYSHELPAVPSGLPSGDFSNSPFGFNPSNANGMPQINGLPQGHGLPPRPVLNGQQRSTPKKNKNAVLTAVEGPVYDRTKSTLIVSGIPDENFMEDEVRGFFAPFGNITELSLHPYKRMARIKFDTWDEANAAYMSPKVMFDNRFVKVFWLKEDESNGFKASKNGANGRHSKRSTNGQASDELDIKMKDADDTMTESAELEFDMEEFKEKQRLAQQAHDERMSKRQAIRVRQDELQQRLAEIDLKRAEEKQKLRAKLGTDADDAMSDRSESPEIMLKPQKSEGASTPSAQTEAIRAQLAALEAEALSLGLDPNEPEDSPVAWAPRGRGRGSRGYMPRGRGRGRGLSINDRHSAYAAYSLDNRPKKIALSGVDFTEPTSEEALRQYLLLNGDFTDVDAHQAATIISFSDRRAAEKFYYSLGDKTMPGVDGVIEVAWVTGSQPTRVAMAATSPVKNGNLNIKTEANGHAGDDAGPATAAGRYDEEEGEIVEQMDFDVADGW